MNKADMRNWQLSF